jgi:hypothetical protein
MTRLQRCAIRFLAPVLMTAAIPAAFAEAPARPPVKVFLDTDVCVDAGDLAALAMLHGLAGRGEIEILGVTCVTSNPHAPGCVDAVNGWYGRPGIPVGALKEPGFLEKSDYSEHIAKTWPNRYADGPAAAPDATTLFRRIVAAQPDGSVILVSIGPLRNVRRFLESVPDAASALNGRDLIAKKVKALSCMACVFKAVNPYGKGDLKVEWNIEQDVPSAKAVFANWPTDVMASGFEIGWPLHADQGLVDAHPQSPVAWGLKKQGGGRPAWDQTSLLYAARGLGGYWEAEGPGRCEIRDDGSNAWTVAPGGRHFFLKAKMEAKALARLIDSIQLEAEQKRAAAKEATR